MELPEALVSQIREGRVVLLLGAGASLGATDAHGSHPPKTKQLAKMLAKEFLSEAHMGHDLMTVAELAISETSLPTVQEFIASLLANFEPSSAHLLLPTFRWQGLATTNYDRLVEIAYEQESRQAQNLVPIISDADHMDDALRGENRLALLKLHGCLSRTRDDKVPFILTPDQYVTHRRHRDTLFATLKEWGANNTLVAVGQSLRDPDLRRVLLELQELGPSRPRYYLVGPDFTNEEQRFWESRRITPLVGSFQDFVATLDAKLPSPLRRVLPTDHDAHPFERHLERTLLQPTLAYLNSEEVEPVYAGMPVDRVNPSDFYRGLSPPWAGVEQGLDVRRRLVDTLLYDAILTDEADRRSKVEFFVIKAEAGAGKSLCLQRIAWDAALDDDRPCLFVGPQGHLDYDAIADITASAGQRVFLFVDNAADHVTSLDTLLRRARRDGLLLTIISAERQNQWNIYCDRLDSHITDEYRLTYLSESEIEILVGLLQEHRSLGYLERLSSDKRAKELERRAGRQLLVALLEATHGRPFQEILVDEFQRIEPESAKALYLTVCVLNRLDIPVRAGVISRIHGIPFTAFKESLFKPLEHVVQVREGKGPNDYSYVARHALIAEVVFERVLTSRDRRFDEYLRLLGALNLSYDTDRLAFRRMIRGRTILDLFPDYDDAQELFRVALQLAPDDPHVFHQRGIYEMRRPNGSLDRAHDFLSNASRLAPQDSTITHSLAELELRRGDLSTTDVQQKRHWDEAVSLANTLRGDPVQGAYGYQTILKTQLARLKSRLDNPGGDEGEIDRMLQDIERTLDGGLQRFPGSDYLLTIEAEFAEILKDHERARVALAAAFDRNKRSPFIAPQLARVLDELGQRDEAVKVLETAVEANPSNQQLNFAYAMMLHKVGQGQPETMLHYLRRSFGPGDQNYQAQFWYGCYLYMNGSAGSASESRTIFRNLWNAALAYQTKTEIRAYFCTPDGTRLSFTGVVRRREDRYGWIDRDGTGDSVMVREQNLEPGVWEGLRERARVRFEIGFCFGGPVAINVTNLSE